MRKTEFIFGLCAGTAGVLLAALSLLSLLPYLPEPGTADHTYAFICLAANIFGIFGALIVQKYNIAGAVIMAAAVIAVMLFGFPWQSLPAVLYIISVVMAAVPVKAAAK